MDDFRPIWGIHIGQSMHNHGEKIGVQAIFQTNFDNFRPIWSSLDKCRPFETNLGQSKTNLGNSPQAIDAKSWKNGWRSGEIMKQGRPWQLF